MHALISDQENLLCNLIKQRSHTFLLPIYALFCGENFIHNFTERLRHYQPTAAQLPLWIKFFFYMFTLKWKAFLIATTSPKSHGNVHTHVLRLHSARQSVAEIIFLLHLCLFQYIADILHSKMTWLTLQFLPENVSTLNICHQHLQLCTISQTLEHNPCSQDFALDVGFPV